MFEYFNIFQQTQEKTELKYKYEKWLLFIEEIDLKFYGCEMKINENEGKQEFRLILNQDKEEDRSLANDILYLQNKTGISSPSQFIRFCIKITVRYYHKLEVIFNAFEKMLYIIKKINEKLSLK